MTEIKARRTLYNGIQMRSRLEADYAAELDRQGYRWAYEPDCFASAEGQWLPDFGCSFAESGPFAIFDEIKPADPLASHIPGSAAFIEHVDTLLIRMATAWASRPDAYLRLVFWQYGGGEYLSLHCGRKGRPWMSEFAGQPMSLLWPGMGQFTRCRRAS